MSMEGDSLGIEDASVSVNPLTPIEQDCSVVHMTSGDVIVISYHWRVCHGAKALDGRAKFSRPFSACCLLLVRSVGRRQGGLATKTAL